MKKIIFSEDRILNINSSKIKIAFLTIGVACFIIFIGCGKSAVITENNSSINTLSSSVLSPENAIQGELLVKFKQNYLELSNAINKLQGVELEKALLNADSQLFDLSQQYQFKEIKQIFIHKHPFPALDNWVKLTFDESADLAKLKNELINHPKIEKVCNNLRGELLDEQVKIHNIHNSTIDPYSIVDDAVEPENPLILLDTVNIFDLQNKPRSFKDTFTPKIDYDLPFNVSNPLPAVIPNDPYYNYQWHLTNKGQNGGTKDADTDANRAWAIANGKEVIVAIPDTGVRYTHEDLKNNIWINSNETADNGIDDDNNGFIDDYYGWDFGSRDNDPFPINGFPANYHGTVIAGIIAAEMNNNIGIASVSPKTKIMSIRIQTSDGGLSFESAFWGLMYATDNDANIINCSWTVKNPSDDEIDLAEMIFQYAESRNVLIITAAANSDSETKPDALPHILDASNQMLVAATDANDKKADFSNYGTWIDMSAPGVGIVSTGEDNDSFYYTDNSEEGCSGTSYAAPIVAGVGALIKSITPSVSASEIKGILMETADPIDNKNPGYKGKLGAGRVNASNAVEKVRVKVKKICYPY